MAAARAAGAARARREAPLGRSAPARPAWAPPGHSGRVFQRTSSVPRSTTDHLRLLLLPPLPLRASLSSAARAPHSGLAPSPRPCSFGSACSPCPRACCARATGARSAGRAQQRANRSGGGSPLFRSRQHNGQRHAIALLAQAHLRMKARSLGGCARRGRAQQGCGALQSAAACPIRAFTFVCVVFLRALALREEPMTSARGEDGGA